MKIEFDKHTFTADILINRGIEKIVFDSVEATAKTLFCALLGTHTDGHNFIAKAKAQGCTTFLISDERYLSEDSNELYIITQASTRLAMAEISAIFYHHPSTHIKVIGVTGTDGKSSTSYFIYQLLTLLGYKTGLITTVSLKTNETIGITNNNMRQSTPEAPQIDAALTEMIASGFEYAVVEATSHGLATETARLSQINFIAGAFTNVTIEHLEFHKTLEKYRLDKAELFRNIAKNHGISVINAEDPHYELYITASQGSKQIILYGKTNRATLFSSDEKTFITGNHFTLNYNHETCAVDISLPGRFNIENTLASIALVTAVTEQDLFKVAALAHKLEAPRGRMKVVAKEPFSVIVDYAHTPGSFEKLFPQIKALAQGRLIVVFGSGGERNHEKRPIQGKIADKYAEIIILTDEDPRLEDSWQILEDIATGIKNKERDNTLFLIANREKAIQKAFQLALPNDVVLLLGKGHEGSIITATGKQAWNEEAVAKKLLGLS